MSKKQSALSTEVGPRTWGDLLRLAYYQAKRTGKIRNYEHAAEMVSQVMPVEPSTVTRLNLRDEMPTQRRTLLLAYYLLVVYGFDPTAFGINEDELGLPASTLKMHRDLLIRHSACSSEYAA